MACAALPIGGGGDKDAAAKVPIRMQPTRMQSAMGAPIWLDWASDAALIAVAFIAAAFIGKIQDFELTMSQNCYGHIYVYIKYIYIKLSVF